MKTVCVVGLGPSGLTVVKELKEVGIQVKAFDKSCRVGGRWSLDPTISTGVWKELCFNSTRRATCYSCFAWKEDKYATRDQAYADKFPHNTEVQSYLQDYAEHFDILPSCHLETTVVSVDRPSELSASSAGSWKVTTKDRKGKESVHECDGVVVCSGRFIVPRNPLLGTSLQNFKGKVVHSKDLGSIRDFSGKTVVIVGSSISGGDISSNLAREGGCQKVINSVRHIPYVVDKVSPVTGLPLDEFLWQRLPVWLGRFLPASIVAQGLKGILLEQYPNQLKGDFKADEDVRKAGITLSVDYVKAVDEGKLAIKPEIVSSDNRTLTFSDGTKESGVDVVIAATGYEVDLSYLPSDVQGAVLYDSPYSGAKEVALYKHTLVPGTDDLAFVGVFNSIGPTLLAFEMQARYIAAIWSGKLKRPSERQLQAGVAKFKKYRQENPNNKANLCVEVSEDLGDELGLTPSPFQAFWKASSLLTGPLHPVYYRTNPKVEGAQVAKKAQEEFDDYMKRPDKVEDAP